MPILYQDKQLAFNLHKYDGTDFILIKQIIYEEIISGDCEVNINDTGTYKVGIKASVLDFKIFNEDNLYILERKIFNGEFTASKYFVVTDKQWDIKDGIPSVTLNGINIIGIEKSKIIGTTTNYTTIVDPDNIPDDFYKYKVDGVFDTLFRSLYVNVLETPQELAYGQALAIENDRKIKGLGNINSSNLSTTNIDVQIDASTYLFDAKNHFLDRLDLNVRTEFVLNNNKIDVNFENRKTLNLSLVSNPNDLVSFSFSKIKSKDFLNYYQSKGEELFYANSKNLTSDELTTYEKTVDSQGTTNDSLTYLDDDANTGLQQNNKSQDYDIEIVLHESVYFIDYNVNDVINISGSSTVNGNYIVTQITETIDTESVDSTLKLELL